MSTEPYKVHPELLNDFEDKWRDDSPDFPVCAHCDAQIGSAEEDEVVYYMGGTGGREQAFRIFRPHPEEKGQQQELAFHVDCAKKRGLL